MFRRARKTLACLFVVLVITGFLGAMVLASDDTTSYVLYIAYIDYRTNDDEVVVLLNRGREPIDLTGYVIRSERGQQEFKFGVSSLNPHNPVIQPLDIVRVHVKYCGPFADPKDFIWINEQGECYKGNVWNDKGDVAILYSPTGDPVDVYSY